MVGKEHITSLYSPARERAFTKRNITAVWAASDLFPRQSTQIYTEAPRSINQSKN